MVIFMLNFFVCRCIAEERFTTEVKLPVLFHGLYQSMYTKFRKDPVHLRDNINRVRLQPDIHFSANTKANEKNPAIRKRFFTVRRFAS